MPWATLRHRWPDGFDGSVGVEAADLVSAGRTGPAAKPWEAAAHKESLDDVVRPRIETVGGRLGPGERAGDREHDCRRAGDLRRHTSPTHVSSCYCPLSDGPG
jgi:hypothetical protein